MNSTMTKTTNSFLVTAKADFNQYLQRYLQHLQHEDMQLYPAIAYSLQMGGKRIRPALVYATAALFGTPPTQGNIPALAVEMIHTYSLIHDDLPAMDNADFRRGKPACHKRFDEATAILAGDALQAMAFDILMDDSLGLYTDKQRLAFAKILAHACGPQGMAEGQMRDLKNNHQTLDALQSLHQLKTGKLIEASVKMGAIAANQFDHESLEHFAQSIGLAFQMHDDILDAEGDPALTGKPSLDADKKTFVQFVGLDKAKTLRDAEMKKALTCLEGFGIEADGLQEIAAFIISRQS